jgi:hypothetical protein
MLPDDPIFPIPPPPTDIETAHQKAIRRGQRVFTLVEQDFTTPRTILFWMTENIETAPDSKLRSALEHALAFRRSGFRKHAD